MTDSRSSDKQARISLKEFLEKIPPGSKEQEVDLTDALQLYYDEPPDSGSLESGGEWRICFPPVLCSCEHCEDDSGEGLKRFTHDPVPVRLCSWEEWILTFRCSNCAGRGGAKRFALLLYARDKGRMAFVHKIGEDPPFGEYTPERVLRLLGKEKEYFLKGRRCENQGLGIGAFSYYRRVVENCKNELIDKLIDAATTLAASPKIIADLQSAKKEKSFLKAFAKIKNGLPSSLLIADKNPLTLLHASLSEGLHMHQDDDCLARATEIRAVLLAMVARVDAALKEHESLKSFVGRLSNPVSKRRNQPHR